MFKNQVRKMIITNGKSKFPAQVESNEINMSSFCYDKSSMNLTKNSMQKEA